MPGDDRSILDTPHTTRILAYILHSHTFFYARWGRGSETFGEDPVLTSKLVQAIVQALQGNSSEKFVKISATCKVSQRLQVQQLTIHY
jgi:hypothetical protein